MQHRISTQRQRLVNRVALAVTAVGITVAGVIAVPLVASATVDPASVETAAFAMPVGTADKDEDPTTAVSVGDIRPGAEITTDLGSCTVNFLYQAGDRVFVGYAAHCSSPSTALFIDDEYCMDGSDPLGTEVLVEGAENPATLAYSSWIALEENNVGPGDECMYNDFALAELSAKDADNIDPSVPELGGPEAVDVVQAGDEPVFGYLPNQSTPAVKQGRVAAVLGDGLSYMVQTDPDTNFGDSGGPYLDEAGNAFGVLSGGAPDSLIADDGFSLVTDLSMALSYAVENGVDLDDLELLRGDEPFFTDGVDMTDMPGEITDLDVLDVLGIL